MTSQCMYIEQLKHIPPVSGDMLKNLKSYSPEPKYLMQIFEQAQVYLSSFWVPPSQQVIGMKTKALTKLISRMSFYLLFHNTFYGLLEVWMPGLVSLRNSYSLLKVASESRAFSIIWNRNSFKSLRLSVWRISYMWPSLRGYKTGTAG